MRDLLIVLSTVFLVVCLSANVFSQEEANQFVNAGDSDPAAIKILDELKAKYESFESLEMDFSIIIDLPEEDEDIIQKGKLAQSGDKFRLDMEDKSVISNGALLWFYLKNNNEVQINDASILEEDTDDLFSPNNLMKLYQSDDFIFVLSQEYNEGGKSFIQIECKPIAKDNEFSKMRMTIDKKKKELVSVKAFSKDGSRYTFKCEELVYDKSFDASHFNFDPAAFPDIYVEDLRIP